MSWPMSYSSQMRRVVARPSRGRYGPKRASKTRPGQWKQSPIGRQRSVPTGAAREG